MVKKFLLINDWSIFISQQEIKLTTMTFDQDYFRNILFEVEKLPPASMMSGKDFIQQYKQVHGADIVEEYIIDYVKCAEEAGFVDAGFGSLTSGALTLNYVSRLTFQGHQYLAKIRDETTWNAVKNKIQKNGLTASVDIISRVAEKYIQHKLGL
jgi:hypothetical protein